MDYVWCSIAYEIFRRDEWEETDIDLVEADLERPSKLLMDIVGSHNYFL